MIYRPTALEFWVIQFYKRLRILEPVDINEQKICHALGIHLYYKEASSMSYECGRFKSITIDSRMSKQIQREHFYHELCHILRHAGRQMMMPASFRELQENDARNFTRYASIPLHMIKRFDLKSPDIIWTTAEQFGISEELCVERLGRIKDKMDLFRSLNHIME